MTTIRKFLALSLVATTLGSGVLFGQDHHDNHGPDQGHHDGRDPRGNNGPGRGNNGYVRHNDWKRGHRMDQNDWNRGQRIDYRTYHLRAPRRGYEWRQVDGNYVMAAIATGVIVSAIAASSAR